MDEVLKFINNATGEELLVIKIAVEKKEREGNKKPPLNLDTKEWGIQKHKFCFS